MKPYAESSDQNKDAIFEVLGRHLGNTKHLLEIGSGTGQHAVFFAEKFPHVFWQTSDLEQNHSGIQAWIDHSEQKNIGNPLTLDVNRDDWPIDNTDVVFSANAVHIMDWQSVEKLFSGVGRILGRNGLLILYGPFNYRGEFTSESNARFDAWLKDRNSQSGIRDFEKLDTLAEKQAMRLMQDYAMPANNRSLIWQKHKVHL